MTLYLTIVLFSRSNLSTSVITASHRLHSIDPNVASFESTGNQVHGYCFSSIYSGSADRYFLGSLMGRFVAVSMFCNSLPVHPLNSLYFKRALRFEVINRYSVFFLPFRSACISCNIRQSIILPPSLGGFPFESPNAAFVMLI